MLFPCKPGLDKSLNCPPAALAKGTDFNFVERILFWIGSPGQGDTGHVLAKGFLILKCLTLFFS